MPLRCSGVTITIICGLISGIVLETIILAVLAPHCLQNDGTTINICKEPLPNKTSKIIKQIDNDIYPCDHFRKFVSGNSFENNSFPEYTTETYRQIHDMTQQFSPKGQHIVMITAMKLFGNCINGPDIPNKDDDYIHSLLKTLNEAVGGWPLLQGSDWNETQFDWQQATRKLREMGFPYSIFFDVRITKYGNMARYMATSPKLEFHREVLTEVATKLFGADRDKIVEEMHEMAVFVSDMIKGASLLGSDLNDGIENFKNIMGIFTDNATITTVDGVFLKRYAALAITSKRAQANYMVWKVLEEMIDLKYPSYLRELLSTVFRHKITTKEEDCFDVISRRFVANPIAIMYARKYIPMIRSDTAKELILNIKAEFLKLLNQTDWMDKIDLQNTANKVNSVGILIGAPEEHYADDILDEMNIELEETTDDSALSLMLNINKNYQAFYTRKNILNRGVFYLINLNCRILGDPEYSYAGNRMIIPLGLLGGFIFHDKLPNYFNYGSLGTIIASGFVNILENQQWANKTKEAFVAQMNCLAMQLEANNSVDNTKHFGYMILKQHLVMRLSHAAYQKWSLKNIPQPIYKSLNYTSNQLWWISFAQLWNGKLQEDSDDTGMNFELFSSIVLNNEEFAKDFNCTISNTINPVRKCKIF